MARRADGARLGDRGVGLDDAGHHGGAPRRAGTGGAGEGGGGRRPAVRRPGGRRRRAGIVAARPRGGRARLRRAVAPSRRGGAGVALALAIRIAEPFVGRFYSTEGIDLQPRPTRPSGPPIWIGSWGSEAGLRRTARLADGWLASAYNTTPAAFAVAWTDLQSLARRPGPDAGRLPQCAGDHVVPHHRRPGRGGPGPARPGGADDPPTRGRAPRAPADRARRRVRREAPRLPARPACSRCSCGRSPTRHASSSSSGSASFPSSRSGRPNTRDRGRGPASPHPLRRFPASPANDRVSPGGGLVARTSGVLTMPAHASVHPTRHRGRRTRQDLRRGRGRPRCLLHRRSRRGLRLPRPQRGREEHDDQHAVHARAAHVRYRAR